MVQMILGTDMANHFGDQLAFKEGVVEAAKQSSGGSAPTAVTISTKVKFLRMALHISDISNPTKSRELSDAWTERLMTEFFAQGDREAAAGLPLSPMCDRAATSVARSQVGFMDVIVRPSFELWFEAPQVMKDNPAMRAEVLSLLEANKQFWADKVRAEKELAGGGAASPTASPAPVDPSAESEGGDDGVSPSRPLSKLVGSHASPLPSLAEDDNEELEKVVSRTRLSIDQGTAGPGLKPLVVLGTPKTTSQRKASVEQ